MRDGSVAAIDVRNLTKVFGSGSHEVRALDDVSLAIARNEFFTLLGPSGCGKTTLLRLIAGFEQPSSGHILLEGDDIAGLPPFKRPVNTVFQSYALFPHMSVAENISFGLEMQGWDKAKISSRVGEMLDLVQMGSLGDRRPGQLSGGQQQRVALARALANQPKVLLLDEPLSALDFKLRKEMQVELKRLQRETGITFVFVTHDQEEALTMSDRVAVMSNGEVQQAGGPEEIYERPVNRFVADFIGETNFLQGAVEREGESYRLPGGFVLSGRDPHRHAPGTQVTLALRPERADLVAEPGDGLAGEVTRIVYFGTDTLYFVALEGAGLEEAFQARVQNREGAVPQFAVGDRVGVEVAADAVQVLAD
jgi:spermidine/putrescine transport system ATP-binding protein